MGSIQNSNSKLCNDQTTRQVSLAIIGGGISGLCLALGILSRAPDINIHIYEAAARFSEIGAGLAFGINAQRALWKLDSRIGERYSKLKTSNVDFNVKSSESNGQDDPKQTYLRVMMGMNHATKPEFHAGTEICEIFCEGGFSSVHRARFLDQLVELLPRDVRENCVTFGAKLVSVDDTLDHNGVAGVKLLFQNGHTAAFDAVIGCDGIRSQVRQSILGDESQPVFTGKYAYRGLIPMDEAVASLGDRSARNAHHRLGYDGHVLTFPIDKGNTMNVVAFRTKTDRQWPGNADWIQSATKQDMIADFNGWGEEVHAILGLMESCDKWALFNHPPTSTYHLEGRMCVIGDAAHGSTPHQGSAAGMAVEDALLMSTLLRDVKERGDLRKAFTLFEEIRLKRTQDLVQASREQAEIYDFQAQGIKDDVEKIAQILPHRWDWIWDHDLERELSRAKKMMIDE